eukprot:6127303-Lingulodinium_polyedra.AAC.1
MLGIPVSEKANMLCMAGARQGRTGERQRRGTPVGHQTAQTRSLPGRPPNAIREGMGVAADFRITCPASEQLHHPQSLF